MYLNTTDKYKMQLGKVTEFVLAIVFCVSLHY